MKQAGFSFAQPHDIEHYFTTKLVGVHPGDRRLPSLQTEERRVYAADQSCQKPFAQKFAAVRAEYEREVVARYLGDHPNALAVPTRNDATPTPVQSTQQPTKEFPMRSVALEIVMIMSLAVAGLVGFSATPASADEHGAGATGCSLSPDSANFPTYYNFHDQCDRHDWCYDQKNGKGYGWGWYAPGVGWTGRLACDNRFYGELTSWCASYYWNNAWRRGVCYGVAYTYYTAVRNFGGPYFMNPYLT
jgi:Prokaryotic phospholipase A2